MVSEPVSDDDLLQTLKLLGGLPLGPCVA